MVFFCANMCGPLAQFDALQIKFYRLFRSDDSVIYLFSFSLILSYCSHDRSSYDAITWFFMFLIYVFFYCFNLLIWHYFCFFPHQIYNICIFISNSVICFKSLKNRHFYFLGFFYNISSSYKRIKK